MFPDPAGKMGKKPKQVLSGVGQHHLEQTSSVPMLLRPVAGSELDLTLSPANLLLCETTDWAGHAKLQAWLWVRLELEPAESSPAAATGWAVLGPAVPPQCCPGAGERRAAGHWTATIAWVSCFMRVVSCIFVPPASCHIRAADKTCILMKGLRYRASPGCPGSAYWHVQATACAHGNTKSLWQHTDSELDPGWQLCYSASADVNFSYRQIYLRIRLHTNRSGLKQCLVIYAVYEYTTFEETLFFLLLHSDILKWEGSGK